MDASLILQQVKLQQKLREIKSDIDSGVFEGYMLEGKQQAEKDVTFLLEQIDKVDEGKEVDEGRLDGLYSMYRDAVEWILIEAGII